MPDEPMTMEATAAKLQDGDVAILHVPVNISHEQAVRMRTAFEAFWEAQGIKVPTLILDGGITLEIIPASRLRALGWVRIDGREAQVSDEKDDGIIPMPIPISKEMVDGLRAEWDRMYIGQLPPPPPPPTPPESRNPNVDARWGRVPLTWRNCWWRIWKGDMA